MSNIEFAINEMRKKDHTNLMEQTTLKCEELTKEIKQKLYAISNELSVDMNTLYLTFEDCLDRVKQQIILEYIQQLDESCYSE